MPRLFIHVRNSEYRSRDDGGEYDSAEAALAVGVQSAIVMAGEEIARGQRSAAVEVNVEGEDGTRLLSTVVAISVSPLMAEPGSGSEPAEPITST